MIVRRLAPRRHAARLDGAGNRDTGARWNSGRGRGVVYTSLNVATCVLETFVHLGPRLRAKLPDNLVLVEIAVPDDAGIFEVTPTRSPRTPTRPTPPAAPGPVFPRCRSLELTCGADSANLISNIAAIRRVRDGGRDG